MRWFGPAIVVICCAIAAWLGATAIPRLGAGDAVSLAAGATAIVAMGLALMLAARPRFAEPLFGGLDRMYRVHKWLGISALALMVLHYLVELDFDERVRETRLGDLAGEIGEIAFFSFIALILLSWIKRIPAVRAELPYQWWRFSHRFMGIPFAGVALHQALIDSPITWNAPLSLYLDAFCILGLAAYLQTELRGWTRRKWSFTVAGIARHGSATEITLKQTGRAVMPWRPGQFAFFSAPEAGLSEPHPFTIASAPRPDGSMTLAVKSLGDWTGRLPRALQPGSTVTAEGPYGRFTFRKGPRAQLWLAGGIGITPFLAWAESLGAADGGDIHLVLCVTRAEEAIGLDVLQQAAARNPRFSFRIVASDRDGRLSAQDLVTNTPFRIAGAEMSFCGPVALKEGIVKGLIELGQAPRSLRFEHFAFR
ncbi:ferredoxin reductase family protein [Paracoccaceae bacterium Fryx2]|nr:ferredoxin reductase family protein [Paracoccaceae bacterium Fryx2]